MRKADSATAMYPPIASLYPEGSTAISDNPHSRLMATMNNTQSSMLLTLESSVYYATAKVWAKMLLQPMPYMGLDCQILQIECLL